MTACTNLKNRKQIELNEQQKKSLVVLLEQIKDEFSQNKTDTLRNSLAPGLKNMVIKNRLNELDTRGIKIFSTEPIFEEDSAENTIALNAGSETLYYQVRYNLEDTNWKIIEFTERRK
jgi:hypothetical protein